MLKPNRTVFVYLLENLVHAFATKRDVCNTRVLLYNMKKITHRNENEQKKRRKKIERPTEANMTIKNRTENVKFGVGST